MKVFIACPCYGGLINYATAGGIYMTGGYLSLFKIDTFLYFVNNESYIPAARNRIAEYFMQSDSTHLLSVDADIGFNAKDVKALIDMNVDFAAGAYRYKNDTGNLVYHEENGEITGVGAGFCLLTKNVFKRIQPICKRITTDFNSTGAINYYGPIMEGSYMFSEDMSFCKRWREVGGKINVKTDLDLVHFGIKGYSNK